MSDPTRQSGLEIQIAPASSALPANDPRWQGQVSQLLADLRRAGEVRKSSTPQPGSKGAVEDIFLALGTSGAITAAVAIFKAWLTRSGDRTVTIKGRIDGREIDVTLDAKNVNEKTLQIFADLLKGK
jgi:hypothetical protein